MGCIQSGPVISVDGKSYRIVENIGEGGFSQVDLCREVKSGQLCVAKRILCHSQADTDKALREAANHARFRHPNLLPCLGHATGEPLSPAASSQPGLAEVTLLLPYHKRGTLAEELELCRIAKSSVGLNRVLSTLSGLCSGLAAMHAAGLAHRDLKTGNILLEDSLRPVIMDFGSATEKLVWIDSRQAALKWQDYAAEHCSMTYRAPELFTVPCPGVLSEKTDIWSLGCILYALCFNESPFDTVYSRGDSVALAVCSGIKVGAAKLEEFDYPSDLIQLIRDMGHPEPERRPSLAECLTALEPMLLAAGLPLPDAQVAAELDAAGDGDGADTATCAVSDGDIRLDSLQPAATSIKPEQA